MDFSILKEKCIEKLKRTSARIKDEIPYTTENGIYNDYSGEKRLFWWTNSFWAGIMWQMYDETGEKVYSDYAISIEEKLRTELYRFDRLDHDLGFLWLLTGVENYRHTESKDAKNAALLAASILASRFCVVPGIIRAWNFDRTDGIAIIDCMMNLPLLHWASKELGDRRFSDIAKTHADNVMKHFVREDGSVCHIVKFDENGVNAPIECEGQGYSVGSAWTRGQGWAIYGFIQSYQWTKEERYLETSMKVADYFISEAEKIAYKIKCDFRQPEDAELYDSSASAIAACGMIEIYKATKDEKYLEATKKLLEVCDKEFCPWDDKNDEALMNYGCAMYREPKQQSLIYGDYYFFSQGLLVYKKSLYVDTPNFRFDIDIENPELWDISNDKNKMYTFKLT